MIDSDILTTKEVARILKLHPFTVKKYARERRIPAFKLGGDWRFSKRFLDEWINKKMRGVI
ncbi:MAG: helix-turn-helix domain-containing protein, partial [Candidatus Omnitrophota bacterium]